jgi:hypothetical protein
MCPAAGLPWFSSTDGGDVAHSRGQLICSRAHISQLPIRRLKNAVLTNRAAAAPPGSFVFLFRSHAALHFAALRWISP